MAPAAPDKQSATKDGNVKSDVQVTFQIERHCSMESGEDVEIPLADIKEEQQED
jgi:hypothetical protein